MFSSVLGGSFCTSFRLHKPLVYLQKEFSMKLKKVGFFKELGFRYEQVESIYEVVRASPDPNEDKIICYLESGEIFLACASPSIDVLLKEKRYIGALKILTDGVWAWSSDLAYYVKEYHIALNNDFISHMSNNGWVINKDAIDLEGLGSESIV